ncbi:PREDICTED: 26S proteasome non-ATPase regulatory subunit 12-like [Branchiostoma belcheri]|uniref:26S proteasome non-ATPase regulatory subunit 12 n=1 Tax=Branchiostoma belcheri TaxID=7741 RepID=A0A6P4XBF2_BRABE|nr:PREDICTED: 26S proteasome non-ATPase regulatory subunit 12-like [Branchiostoma belcheri]
MTESDVGFQDNTVNEMRETALPRTAPRDPDMRDTVKQVRTRLRQQIRINRRVLQQNRAFWDTFETRNSSNMADEGRLPTKMEVDYSATVDEKLPICENLAKEGKLQEALDILLSLEKQTRTAADMHSTARILVKVVQLCFERNNWEALNENIILLSKRRSQLKQAITKMVQEAVTYVDKTPNMETKLKLIDTLRTVTEGKIYVEIERARLTRILAKIKEDEGNITEAANVLQDLQVETFGSMEKKEKVEFILEQMRLCLAKKDYIRTQIISKKINTKVFSEKDTEELKLKYYQLMVELDLHEGSYLQICKHYRAIYETDTVKENKEQWQQALKCVVLNLVLSPYDNEQSDLLHRVYEDKNLEEIPKYKELLKNFMTAELMRWGFVCEIYEQELRKGSADSPATDIFPHTETGDKRWAELRNRVVEHNIRIMAKYYTRITMKRMAQLLDLSEDETEEFLSKLVVDKTVYAKADRLDGVVTFARPKDPNDILNEWSHNLNQLMQLVNKTTHLITKEEMVHKLQH